jgi:predicted TIM-barrel fold metal-dependent hydrolase
MKGAGVDGAVLVPPGWAGGRPEFALEGAARHPDQFKIMGRIAINNPESTALMAGWKAPPGMLGIRMGLYRETDAKAAAAMESLIPLADLPNLYVKVSSVPLYSTEPYPYRGLHWALERLICAFGPRRAFWGTDFTRISPLVESYRHCVTLFTQELDFLAPDDLDWVMDRGLAQCLDWRLSD